MLFSQDSSMKLSAVAAALALIPSVAAHGYVSSIVTGGKTYIGSNPNWYYQPAGSVVDTAGWFAMNQDNGFVSPDSYGTADIACHKSAKPGTLQIPVTAGDSVTLVWNTWPDSHKGPVIDYMAKCAGSCTSASASSLDFFKIDQQGLIDDSSPPGTWATDDLINASPAFSWKVTIPSGLASGSYVLRHEIIALHAAGSANGAQNYPQCINFEVTSSGSSTPAGEPATSFYKEDDPGILISVYNKITNYIIPGPAVAAIGGGSSGGSGGGAPTTVSAPKTTMITSTKPVTTAAKTSTTTAAPKPTTSSSSGGAALYAQCGGQGWTGPTTCASGTCKASGSYYSQCLP